MKQILLAFASFAVAFAAGPPAVGERPPSFALKNLEGKARGLGQGPVVLLVLRGFPGYQCPLCNRQVMEFVKRAPDFASAGARVVMVYPGPAEVTQAKANEFVANKNLPSHFELLIDPDYTFTRLYNLRWNEPKETAYPAAFVIGKSGLITFAKVSKSHGGRAGAAEVLAALGR